MRQLSCDLVSYGTDDTSACRRGSSLMRAASVCCEADVEAGGGAKVKVRLDPISGRTVTSAVVSEGGGFYGSNITAIARSSTKEEEEEEQEEEEKENCKVTVTQAEVTVEVRSESEISAASAEERQRSELDALSPASFSCSLGADCPGVCSCTPEGSEDDGDSEEEARD